MLLSCRLQIETDLLGYLRASTPDMRTRLFYTADPLIKLGLTARGVIETLHDRVMTRVSPGGPGPVTLTAFANAIQGRVPA